MLTRLCRKLALDRRAVTAVEYALVAGVMAVVIAGSAAHVGAKLPATFNSVSSEL